MKGGEDHEHGTISHSNTRTPEAQTRRLEEQRLHGFGIYPGDVREGIESTQEERNMSDDDHKPTAGR